MYGRIWKLGHFSSRSVVFPRHGTGTGIPAAAEETVAAEVHSLRVRCRFDRVGYFLYALLFIVFDIETVFLYPWAVEFRMLGAFALIEMFIFVGILVLGLAYAWRKGDLTWK